MFRGNIWGYWSSYLISGGRCRFFCGEGVLWLWCGLGILYCIISFVLWDVRVRYVVESGNDFYY